MISYTLQGRDGKSRSDAAPDAATLAVLRKVFISTGEMDAEDLFRSGGKVVAADKEAEIAITDSLVVAIVPIRRAIAFTDKAGTKHQVFVRPDETLGQFRKNNAKLIADADVFVIDGKSFTGDEDGTYLRRLEELALKPEATPAPKDYKLLLIQDGEKPKEIPWPGGNEDKTLEVLRTFLKETGNAPADLPFLDSAGKPVPLAMEPFETVGVKLGKADEKLKLLRFRFETPRKRSTTTTPSTSTPSTASTAAAAAAAAAAGATASLRETQDLLGPLLGRPPTQIGPPQDVFDRMAYDEQVAVLAAMRHLHGLRFVLAPDGSYELERAPRPAFNAAEAGSFVAVVRPITSTRFSASATQVRTLDSIASSLSWNVGGSVGAEAKAASLSVKSDYKEDRTQSHDSARSEMHLRVEYLVARGEIVIDPDSVELSEQFYEDASALAKNPGSTDRVHALARILNKYGTHVPLRTIFGGKLIYRQDRELSATTDKNTLVRQFSADVQGSYKAVTASARSGFKTENSATKLYESSQQAIEVTASGGNPALALDPYGWAATLSHAGWWNAIAFADIVPLLSLLPKELKDTIVPILLNSNELEAALSTPIDWATYRAQMLKELVRSQRGAEEITLDASTAPVSQPQNAPPAQPVAPPPAANVQPEQPQSQSQSQSVKPEGEQEVEI
jgi:hypothetical protein